MGLKLTRKVGQRIAIGDGVTVPRIWVWVVNIDGNKVQLDVEAPRSVPVDREEVLTERAAEEK